MTPENKDIKNGDRVNSLQKLYQGQILTTNHSSSLKNENMLINKQILNRNINDRMHLITSPIQMPPYQSFKSPCTNSQLSNLTPIKFNNGQMIRLTSLKSENKTYQNKNK